MMAADSLPPLGLTHMQQDSPVRAALLPLPHHVQWQQEHVSLASGLRLCRPATDDAYQDLLRHQQQQINRLLGEPLPDAVRLHIVLSPAATRSAAWRPSLGDNEQYSLRLDTRTAELVAPGAGGIVHGCQRLLQLITTDEQGRFMAPGVHIEDAPRFAWRGLMLDLARRHQPLDTLLRTLDGMAALGLNVLHLHLNDDQGFRVQSLRYPELHRKSAAQGYLSVDEVQQLVREAAWRGIRVVPELDVPGHAGALCWARPELAVGEPPGALPRAFGPSSHVLDPTLDATWEFLEGLVADLVQLFPDEFLHMGGDEVPADAFDFPDAGRRQWCRERNLHSTQQVQSWFAAQMTQLLHRHGRRTLGWDEVLALQPPQPLVVQSWRGVASLAAALHAGYDALFSSGWYLDLGYPAHWHYRFDPGAGAADLEAAQRRLEAEPELRGCADKMRELSASADIPVMAAAVRGRVLGGEACLWSELVTPELLDVRLYERLAAVAERLWSAPEQTQEADFYQRLPLWLHQLQRYTDCRPLAVADELLLRIGVRFYELEWVRELFAVLAPVRWYQRLLGPDLCAQDRAYDADTPLERPVDFLPAESLALRACADELWQVVTGQQAAAATEQLRRRARRWHDAAAGLAALRQRHQSFAELGMHIDALGELADLLQQWLDARDLGILPADTFMQRLRALAQSAAQPAAETRFMAADVLLQAATASAAAGYEQVAPPGA